MRSFRTALTTPACLLLACLLLGASTLAGAPALAATPPLLHQVWALTTVGDEVFFVASDDQHGRALWKSDGTPDGTTVVAVIDPSGADLSYGVLRYERYAAVGDRFFFVADDGRHGSELWVSDGTRRGTRMVEDVHPGADSSSIDWLTARGHQLFFTLAGAKATRLWKSDGTAAGTVRVKTRHASPADPTDLHAWHGDVYFEAGERGVGPGRALWRSDGSARGTRMVTDIRPGSTLDPRIGSFTSAATRLYFVANDGATRGDKNSGIWRTDGTARGTRYVRNVAGGRGTDGDTPMPEQLTTLGDRLLFSDDDCTHGREPWSTDGTYDSTQILDLDDRNATDPRACGVGSDPQAFEVFQGGFDLVARSGDHRALWRTDGTPTGTAPVVDLPASTGAYYAGSRAVGGQLFLALFAPAGASTPAFNALWVSDGTAAGTHVVHDFSGDATDVGVFGGWSDAGGRLVFLVRSGKDSDYALWSSDGTPSGTVPLAG